MNRSARRKVFSVVVIVLLLCGDRYLFAEGGVFAMPPRVRIPFDLAMIAFFLVPIWLMRGYFSARKLLRRGAPEKALEVAQEFVDRVMRQRWRQAVFRLIVSIYTTHPATLGYMCIAAAHIQLGQYGLAIEACERAHALDPLAPMPFVSLAVCSLAMGDEEMARIYLERSRELGYSGSLDDQLMILGGELADRLTPGQRR